MKYVNRMELQNFPLATFIATWGFVNLSTGVQVHGGDQHSSRMFMGLRVTETSRHVGMSDFVKEMLSMIRDLRQTLKLKVGVLSR